jgi:hypothetical protein
MSSVIETNMLFYAWLVSIGVVKEMRVERRHIVVPVPNRSSGESEELFLFLYIISNYH